MAVRKTFKWIVVILLLAGLGGAGFTYWLWTRSDEMLRQMVLQKIDEMAPHVDVTIGRANYDLKRRVRLYDCTLKSKSQAAPIVRVPEIVLTLDLAALTQQQQVVVQKVRLRRPQVTLTRNAQAEWNWQKLLPLSASEMNSPECEIEDGLVKIHIEQPGTRSLVTLGVQHVGARLIPSGKRQYRIQGETEVSKAGGKLSLDGTWDLDAATGTFSGAMQGVQSSDRLLRILAGVSPKFQQQLTRLGEKLQEWSPHAQGRREARQGTPDLGFSGILDVHFHLNRWKREAETEFKLLVDVRRGRMTNRALPFPLRELEGKLYIDNRQLIIREFTAQHGTTRLRIDGRVSRSESAMPARLEVDVSNLALDERLQNRLPASMRRVYDAMQPRGRVDVKGRLTYDANGSWHPEGFVLTARNCTVRHVKFPYPVTGVVGTIRQAGRTLKLDFEGRAGRRPGMLRGTVNDPGPAAEVDLEIYADRLPLDETFVAACSRQPAVGKTFASLNLQGTANAVLSIRHPPGEGRRYRQQLLAKVSEGSLRFDRFAYRVSRLSGTVTWDSEEGRWSFLDLLAEHGTARLSGSGSFSKKADRGSLALNVDVKNAELDKQLKRALPEHLQLLWDNVSPTGKLNVETQIRWVPGQPPVIALPNVEVSKGSLQLKAFPFPLENVSAKFVYADDRIDILSLTGRHDDARVEVRRGHILCPSHDDPSGEWRLHLAELHVDDLVPDRMFRRALPGALRVIAEQLNPRGPVSLTGLLEFHGTSKTSAAVTAAWDLQTLHSGGAVSAGVDVTDVHGQVDLRGTWNGQWAEMEGSLALDSLRVWGYQFTDVRGPLRLKDSHLVVGSHNVFGSSDPQDRSRPSGGSDPVTANAIGGKFKLDAEAFLQDETDYHVLLQMADGSLEQYARRYMSQPAAVRGVMQGWANLRGRGPSPEGITGQGQLRISPAALYELPVVAQILTSLRFAPPDRTAFTYALADFDVAGGQFRLRLIDLIGDAFSFRGEGTARFDGKLNLRFYSMLPRNQLGRLRIPFVNGLLGEAMKGWVGVEVRGSVNDPDVTFRAVPQLDDALRRFLGTFDPRPPGSIPRLVIPQFAPLQFPQIRRPRPFQTNRR